MTILKFITATAWVFLVLGLLVFCAITSNKDQPTTGSVLFVFFSVVLSSIWLLTYYNVV